MAAEPYFGLMKMTMHIDEDVLERVMKITGAKTKRAAVEMALNNLARRHRMKELFREGLGLSPEELKNALDPASYPEFDRPAASAAEGAAPYGKPDPAR